MKIKMLTSMAGSDFVLSPGDETDRFSDAEATRFIEAGYAEAVVAVVAQTASKSTKRTTAESKG